MNEPKPQPPYLAYDAEELTSREPCPHSLEAERGVLGAALLNPQCFWKVFESLSADDFYREPHRLIFLGMIETIEKHGCLDTGLLTETLREKDGNLKRVGGIEYIAKLAYSVPVIAHFPSYVGIVKEKSLMRDARFIAQKMFRDANDRASTTSSVLAASEQAIEELRSRTRKGAANHTMADAVTEALDEAVARSECPSELGGMPTGFAEIDAMTGGLDETDLVVLAGRPAMGKTALGLAIAVFVAEHVGPVLVSSIEMSKKQLAHRLICGRSRVDTLAYRSGNLTAQEWARVYEAGQFYSKLPLHIDEQGVQTVASIRAKARQVQDEGGLALVVLDYLQLLSSHGSFRGTRAEEVASFSSGLKRMCKDLHVPTIAIAQLSRSCETRENKRPVLSDLRESGAIEQDADRIGFLYREEYYARVLGRDPHPDSIGKAELIFGKQRNGPVGHVFLGFEDRYARFHSLKPGVSWNYQS